MKSDLPTRSAVILVNYNNARDTLDCIAALTLLRSPPAHIVVVDNGSHAHETLALREGWRGLCAGHDEGLACLDKGSAEHSATLPRNVLLTLGVNTGFAGGNNAALRLLLTQTDCAAFWLLNNDTVPEPDALNALCARLNECPDAGMCGSTLVYAYTPDKIQSAGGCTLSLWTGATAFLCGGEQREAVIAFPSKRVRSIEASMHYVVGASCMVRREALERAGILPENYFLYYEDAAFSLNIRRAGFSLVWAQDSVVLHKEGGSTNASGGGDGRAILRSAYVDYLSVRNRVALIRRYNPIGMPVVLVSLVVVCANRIRRGQTDRLGLILRAAWHGLIGRMGKPKTLFPSLQDCT